MANEAQIGSDVLHLREAKERLSALDAKAKEMKANIEMAIKVIDGKEALGHTGESYNPYTRPGSIVLRADPLTLPTPQEIFEFVEERSKVKEQVDSLSRKFKDLL